MQIFCYLFIPAPKSIQKIFMRNKLALKPYTAVRVYDPFQPQPPYSSFPTLGKEGLLDDDTKTLKSGRIH